jgi:hypothetical protein
LSIWLKAGGIVNIRAAGKTLMQIFLMLPSLDFFHGGTYIY